MKACSITLALGAALMAGSVTGAQAAPDGPLATLFGRTSASVTYGPYVRIEAGRSRADLDDANWLPPGPSDPRVYFDFSDQDKAFAGLAFGYDWMNGFRADLGLFSAGTVDATGAWSHTVPAVPGPHANITAATVSTRAVLGSVFYSPLEQQRVNSRIQPYLVAGLGLARNRMSDWTRVNAASPSPVRSFAGETSTDLAYSLGLGVAVQLTPPGKHPVMLDLAWRYYDFGTAEGGTTPLTGTGGTPREALKVDRRDSVVSLSVRVPLRRF